MASDTRDYLLRQLEIAWQLTDYHLTGLTTEECLWRPAAVGLHVHREGEAWRADWPETEGYEIGPASIAWLTWHLCFWWSMVLDHSFGPGTLTREAVTWPGSADAMRDTVRELHQKWRDAVSALLPQELDTSERARWPLKECPFAEIVGWASLELMKNAAEIGYARFVYASRQGLKAEGP